MFSEGRLGIWLAIQRVGVEMDIKSLDADALLSLRMEVESEMQSRGIKFSVGELGEQLAIKFFNSTPGLSNLIAAPKGAKNVDALSRNGDRYSIKTVQSGQKTGTVYPDGQEPNKQLFEYLLILRLSPQFSLEAIYEFSWKQFLVIRAWDKRMSAWYVPLSRTRLQVGKRLYPPQDQDKMPNAKK